MIALLRERFMSMISVDGWNILVKFILAAVTIIIFYYIILMISKKIEQKIIGNSIEHNTYTLRTAHLVAQVVFIFLMVCAFLVSLEIVGLNTALIIGGMTIALGFAMEATMGNMIAGVILLGNPHLKVGQSVQILGSIDEIATVEEFHIRYTVLRNLKKQRIIIPNSKLLRTAIQTKKTEPLMRGEIHISISRHYDLEMIKDTLITCINSHEYVSHHNQTAVHVHGFSARGYDLVCYYFFSPLESGKSDFIINAQIRERIAQAFNEKKIYFSYPRKTVSMRPRD